MSFVLRLHNVKLCAIVSIKVPRFDAEGAASFPKTPPSTPQALPGLCDAGRDLQTGNPLLFCRIVRLHVTGPQMCI